MPSLTAMRTLPVNLNSDSPCATSASFAVILNSRPLARVVVTAMPSNFDEPSA